MEHLRFTIIFRWASSVWIFASSALPALTQNRLFYLKPPISSCRDSNLFHILQLHHSLIFSCTTLWQPIFRIKALRWFFVWLLIHSAFSSSALLQSIDSLTLRFSILLHSVVSFLLNSSPQIPNASPNFIRINASKTSLLPPLLFRHLSFSLSQ